MYDFQQIPFADITEFGQRNLLYSDLFLVNWHLGRYCPYNCSYCWPFARSNTKDYIPLDIAKMAIDSVKQQSRSKGYNSFRFSFSGGEPTFHPNFFDIHKHLTDDIENTNATQVHITSNCARPLDWFKEYVYIMKDFHRVSISASLHLEYVNNDKKKQEFADKLLFCQDQNILIIVNIVMNPFKFYENLEEAWFFNDQNLNVSLKPMSVSDASKLVDGYTPAMFNIMQTGMPYHRVKSSYKRPQMKWPDWQVHKEDDIMMNVELHEENGKKWYMDQAERLNTFAFNEFEGWECEAGFRSIIIESDGTVKRGHGCIDKSMGNINTKFSLFDNPLPCFTGICLCSTDLKITKRKK